MPDALLLALAILLGLLLAVPYLLGALYNLRLGAAAVRWLEKGLATISDQATFSRQGSSIVRVKAAHALEPFRAVEILVALEPREFPILWLWARARGRRDLLVFRAQLNRAPHFDVQATKPGAWAGPGPRELRPAKWNAVQGGVANGMQADYRGTISPYSINRLIVAAASGGLTLTRLSIRGPVPNFEAQFVLPPFEKTSARRWFESLRELGELVQKMSA